MKELEVSEAKQSRYAAIWAVLAAGLASFLVALMFVGAIHAPEPHDLDLGVVGPPEVAKGFGQQLERNAGQTFEIHYYSDTKTAEQGILNGDINAAIAPSPDETTLLVANAAGPMAAGQLTETFRTSVERQGGELVVRDLVPTQDGDPAGASTFLMSVSIAIPSIILAALIAVGAGAAAFARTRLLTALIGSGVLAAVVTIMVDPVLGALDGSFWEIAGLGWLLSFALSSATLAFHRLIGMPGVGVAALLFIVCGLPMAGLVFGPDFIPEAYRIFTLAFPIGEALPAFRNVVYFPDASNNLELALLATWAGVASLVMLVGRSAKAQPHNRIHRNEVDKAEDPGEPETATAAE